MNNPALTQHLLLKNEKQESQGNSWDSYTEKSFNYTWIIQNSVWTSMLKKKVYTNSVGEKILQGIKKKKHVSEY